MARKVARVKAGGLCRMKNGRGNRLRVLLWSARDGNFLIASAWRTFHSLCIGVRVDFQSRVEIDASLVLPSGVPDRAIFAARGILRAILSQLPLHPRTRRCNKQGLDIYLGKLPVWILLIPATTASFFKQVNFVSERVLSRVVRSYSTFVRLKMKRCCDNCITGIKIF